MTRSTIVTLLVAALLALGPRVAGAASITTLATYTSLNQPSPFCSGVDPCDFLVVTLEDGIPGILRGLAVRYSGPTTVDILGSDTLLDELSNDPFSLLGNFAVFLNPIPTGASTALIVASQLAYSEAHGLRLETTPLSLTTGNATGFVRLVQVEAVPEPATIALVGPGIAAMIFRRRIRRSRGVSSGFHWR